jgi:hypothetical protein
MNLQEVIQKLDLAVLTDPQDFSQIQISGGYASDLLSCVMAGAKPGNLWITLQAHINIVAVAALTDTAAIIITEGAEPEPDVVARANSQGVTLLGTPRGNHQVSGALWELAIR